MMKGGIAERLKTGSPFSSVEEYRGQLRLNTNYTHAVIDALNIHKGSKFLDIGCGPGYHSAVAYLNGAEVHAIDLSRENVETTKKVATYLTELAEKGELKLPKETKKIQEIIFEAEKVEPKRLEGFYTYHGDATELDKHISDKKEYFDAILILDMLHLVEMTKGQEGVRKVLEHADRLLKKDGKMLVYTSAPKTQKRIEKILEEMGYERIGLSKKELSDADKEALRSVWVKQR